jgi:hypothetical protein
VDTNEVTVWYSEFYIEVVGQVSLEGFGAQSGRVSGWYGTIAGCTVVAAPSIIQFEKRMWRQGLEEVSIL